MILIEAFALVTIVVFVFLGSLRATLVPLVAVPVSLVGILAVMLATGFSANTFILGLVPLLVSGGAGAMTRHALQPRYCPACWPHRSRAFFLIPGLYAVVQRLRTHVKQQLFGIAPAMRPAEQSRKTAAE